MDPTKQSMFYCRMGTGLVFTVLTVIFLTIADIAIAVVYPDIMANDDTACSLKASFSLFIIATIGQVVMAVYDAALLYATVQTNVTCPCECYHMKVISHFVTCSVIFLGAMVYGIKSPERVFYGFWLALVSGFFALANALMWLLTQQTKRFLKAAGVNVSNLEKGKMHDGTDIAK
ncbi:uncharacterized protein [Argopecten irradians]|uniref:uncharacterized protein n=1 Tax=Argopecten irradians TaxID=31199 RepID=UPI00371EFB1D